MSVNVFLADNLRLPKRTVRSSVENGTSNHIHGAEMEAVLRLAGEIAKKHVENGDIAEYGGLSVPKQTC